MTSAMRHLDKWVAGVLVIFLSGLLAIPGWSGLWPEWTSVLVLFTSLALVYGIAAGRLLLQVLFRTALALAPLFLLGAIVIYFAILENDSLETERPALIAATVISSGWLAARLAAEYQTEKTRSQSQNDVLLALRSEIFTAFQTLDATDWEQNGKEVQARIAAGGDDPETAYFPFTASESPTVVLNAVSSSIPLLPPKTIEPVLRFYAALTDLSTLAKDFQRDDFKGLSWQRRQVAHARITDTRKAAVHWGLRAIYAINVAQGVKSPENIPRSGKNQRIVLDSAESKQ